MKVLSKITPTSEQLKIISDPKDGITLIKGAAGSGKTTTALLMLKLLTTFYDRRRKRRGVEEPVNVLVLTYNRTLRGYVDQLAAESIPTDIEVNLEIKTFAQWAKDQTGIQEVGGNNFLKDISLSAMGKLGLEYGFVLDEAEYIISRFEPDQYPKYLEEKRVGRGAKPRMEKKRRQQFLELVIDKYHARKVKERKHDWNDLALELIAVPKERRYDIIIGDEAQDFSANQMKAILAHSKDPGSVVFVLDQAQRIYPRGWSWKEIGAEINPNSSFKLRKNHRNTIEICRLAKPLLSNLVVGDDGSIPDLDSCTNHGEVPELIVGRFSKQCQYAINKIKEKVDIANETVAFSHPKGGGWFDFLRDELRKNGLPYLEMTRRKDWPEGTENIGLITMHSSKGLEFDHVFILGLDDAITVMEYENEDTAGENYLRLLAMAITRARKSVTIGYKQSSKSPLIDHLASDSYNLVEL